MSFAYNKFTTHGLGSAAASGASAGRGVPGSDFLTRARKGRGRKLQDAPRPQHEPPKWDGGDVIQPGLQGLGSAAAAKSYNRNTSGPGRHHGGLRNLSGQGGKGGHGGPINAGPRRFSGRRMNIATRRVY